MIANHVVPWLVYIRRFALCETKGKQYYSGAADILAESSFERVSRGIDTNPYMDIVSTAE
jgi:hypothetical protein